MAREAELARDQYIRSLNRTLYQWLYQREFRLGRNACKHWGWPAVRSPRDEPNYKRTLRAAAHLVAIRIAFAFWKASKRDRA